MSLSFGLEIVPRLTIEALCDQGFVGQVKWQPLRPNLQQPKPIPDDKRPGMTQTRVERQIMCDLGNKKPRKQAKIFPKLWSLGVLDSETMWNSSDLNSLDPWTVAVHASYKPWD